MRAPAVTAAAPGGGVTVLDRVLSLTLSDSLRSPAAEMTCTAAVERLPANLGEVWVHLDGREYFAGRVDRQVSSLSGRGRLVALEARGPGALLLDNEALPGALTGAGIATAFGRFAAPYGFALQSAAGGVSLPLYTVHKGVSEWEALCGFFYRALGRTPYVRGLRVVADAPRSVSALAVGGGGLPFSALEREFLPYAMLSRVVLRDRDGHYSSAVPGGAAAALGVRRTRYVIPPTEFADDPAPDAAGRIRRSMLEGDVVRVTLPGWADAETGQEVRLTAEGQAMSGYMVLDVTRRMDAAGFRTALTLVQRAYYD